MATGLALNVIAANLSKIVSKPIPTPVKDEIVIKVLASGAAIVDAALERGLFPHKAFFKEYPTVLGYDVAGEVHSVGSEVKNFKVGDRVLKSGGIGDREGGNQQYSVSKAVFAAKIPDSFTFDQAATIPLNLSTAAAGFYANVVFGDRTGAGLTAPWQEGGRGKYAGETVVITNGPSSVGQFAIQLAKLSGFSPIITTASSKHTDLLKSLGADVIIDRNASWDEINTQSKAAAGDKPITIVWDVVASLDSQLGLQKIVAPGGHLVLSQSIQIPKEQARSDIGIHQVWGSLSAPGTTELGIAGFAAFPAYFENGDIKPNPVQVIPGGLNGVSAVYDQILAGKVSGAKLVIQPFATEQQL